MQFNLESPGLGIQQLIKPRVTGMSTINASYVYNNQNIEDQFWLSCLENFDSAIEINNSSPPYRHQGGQYHQYKQIKIVKTIEDIVAEYYDRTIIEEVD